MLALDRLIRIGVGADRDHARLVSRRGQFLFEQFSADTQARFAEQLGILDPLAPAGGGGPSPTQVGQLTGFFDGQPTLQRELGFAGLDLDRSLGFAQLAISERSLEQQATLAGRAEELERQGLHQQARLVREELANSIQLANIREASAFQRLQAQLGADEAQFTQRLAEDVRQFDALSALQGREVTTGERGQRLDELSFAADLIRDPTNFIASQQLLRGEGANLDTLFGGANFPGAVGQVLTGQDIGERDIGAFTDQLQIPSFQALNQLDPNELAALPSAVQALGIPFDNFAGQVERQGLRAF